MSTRASYSCVPTDIRFNDSSSVFQGSHIASCIHFVNDHLVTQSILQDIPNLETTALPHGTVECTTILPVEAVCRFDSLMHRHDQCQMHRR